MAVLDQAESTIIDLFRQKAGIRGTVDPQARWEELGISSIMFIDILIAIEDMFGLELGDEVVNFKQFETLGDFLTHASAKIAALR